MFNTIERFCSQAARTLTNPKVRLQADFPWTFAKMAKHYAVTFGLYLAGTFVPVLLFVAVVVGLSLGAPHLLVKLLGPQMENMPAVTVAVTVISFLCGFGLQVWYIARVLRGDGISFRQMVALDLKSLGGSWWAAFWRAALTVAIGIACSQLIQLLPFLPRPNQAIAQFMHSLHGVNLLAIALLAAVAAPVLEEIVFRGFLFNMLRTQFTRGRLGNLLGSQNAADWTASIVSGAIFAAAHMEVSALPGLFVFGVLMAELYRRSGSLVCPILAHAINNGLGVALIVLSQAH